MRHVPTRSTEKSYHVQTDFTAQSGNARIKLIENSYGVQTKFIEKMFRASILINLTERPYKVTVH